MGESGSGKTMTALALMALTPEGARVSGSIRFEGRELVGLGEEAMRQLRGDRIAMIFQEPMTALNPLHSVGAQVAEPLMLHRGLAKAGRAPSARSSCSIVCGSPSRNAPPAPIRSRFPAANASAR